MAQVTDGMSEWTPSEVMVTVMVQNKEPPGQSLEDQPYSKFQVYTFSDITPYRFDTWLQCCIKISTGPIIIIAEGWELHLNKEITKVLPTCPVKLFEKFNSDQMSVAAHLLENGDNGFVIFSQIDVMPSTQKSHHCSPPTTAPLDLRRTLIASWTGMMDERPDAPRRPVILVCGELGKFDTQRLLDYPINDKFKWEALISLPSWICVELFFIYSSWDKVWEEVCLKLNPKTEQIYRDIRAAPSLYDIRDLHEDVSTVGFLREYGKMQIEWIKRYFQAMEGKLGHDEKMSALFNRDLTRLEHFNAVSYNVSEHYNYLLNLALNRTALSENQEKPLKENQEKQAELQITLTAIVIILNILFLGLNIASYQAGIVGFLIGDIFRVFVLAASEFIGILGLLIEIIFWALIPATFYCIVASFWWITTALWCVLLFIVLAKEWPEISIVQVILEQIYRRRRIVNWMEAGGLAQFTPQTSYDSGSSDGEWVDEDHTNAGVVHD